MHGWAIIRRSEIISKKRLQVKILSIDSWITLLKLRLKTLFKSKQRESELDQEMRFHLESLIEENLKNGIGFEDAKNQALKKFGNVEEHKGECRQMWCRIPILNDLIESTRFTVHSFWKSHGFSFTMIGTLALCIGVISGLCSLALRQVPFDNLEQLYSSEIGGLGTAYSLQYPYSKEPNDPLKGSALKQPLPNSTNRSISINKVHATWENKYDSDRRTLRKRVNFYSDKPFPKNKTNYPLRTNSGTRSKRDRR